MESVYLKQLVNNIPEGDGADLNAPFSFLEWKERLPSLIEKDAVYHYNNYVIEWFAKNKEKTVSQSFILRQRYLYLLDQLQLFFSSEEKNAWYNKVNLADEKELLIAIPYFAKKLRDIALYYLRLRNQLKQTKLKYNTVGTTTGLEQEIYSYILGTFSTNNNELSSTIQSTVPSFSALQQSLVVQVEELYDDKQYFDLSPTKPLSGYFNLLHEATSQFLLTKGIVLSSSETLFESFNIPVSSSFDSFVAQLTGSMFETTDTAMYSSFIEKYIAETKYVISSTAATSSVSITDIDIAIGNNYFYYPYGTTDASASITDQIPKVALSSLNIGSATAGSNLETSDTIFVKIGSDVKGAWLRYHEYNEYPKTLKATLKKDNSTSFIYPFPGYGLSGQDLPWTGSTFETTAEYDFLTKDLKSQVNEAYWKQTLPSNSCNTILLNNTTLVSSGATSSNSPQHADQVFIRTDRPTNTTTPYGELSGAWLYRFTKTAIPISPNQENVSLWPYGIIDLEEDYPSHLTNMSFYGACNEVSIQSIPTSFSVAASSLENADKIYKLNNFSDNTSDALECAWLSGASVNNGVYQYTQQDGFTALLSAGQATRFVWTGPETSLDLVFKSVNHRKDCPFVTNNPSVSAFEWQKCSCKQVYHVPFGHPNSSFQEGNEFADCIIKDTENTLSPFDFSSWKDSTGNPAFSSLEFAWYKTSSIHGWGNGTWISNVSKTAPFTLKPGETYFYKRANSKTSDEAMPSYVINYSFGTKNTVWVNAKLNKEQEWISTETPSVMEFYPGDFIKYERQSNTLSYLTSAFEVENTSINKNSVWSVYDYIPVICGKNNSTVISWPIETIPFGSTESQYPATSFTEITAINAWSITREEDNEVQLILNVRTVTFVPPTTGTYSIAVTATKLDGTQVFESTIIPKITAVGPYSTDYDYLEFSTPVGGFLLEHQLKGWNYNTNKIDPIANGARPYWALLDSGKTSTTRFKGIYAWGYQDVYIDDYLPNVCPTISPIEFAYGTIIEYYRKGYSFKWNQPITYKEYVNTSTWCQISSDTTQSSNLSSLYQIKQNPELIAIATTNPSDIELSNTINGAPVEVFYYALNSFVWPVSVTSVIDSVVSSPSAFFEAQFPWTTITNRFYPTIANIPVAEEVYSAEDVGGYFLPQNLGASLFLNKNFSPTLKSTNLSGTYLTEDTAVHIGGRGRTKQDQPTLYTWTEDNQWLKESATTGNLAGATKKSLTKTLQTFVPYQSNIEETPLGLVTTRSRLTPWGGTNDEQWTDSINEPKSFTGVWNVSAWAASQILKQNEKAVDCWTSDIYGNQYGLYKDLSGISIADHIDVSGELWTRTNDQSVSPAYISLSAIFEPFKTANLTVYEQLTGNGIQYIDCYFDTLFIKTPSSLIFAKIDYDYENIAITSTFDDTRYTLLNAHLRHEKNWFFASEKRVVSLITEISGTTFQPHLYELDLSTRIYRKIFPTNTSNRLNLISNLSSIQVSFLSNASIHFNRSLNTFLLTYTGIDTADKMFVTDVCVTYEDELNLTKINTYIDLFDDSIITEPPIVLSHYLSAINVGTESFTMHVSASNSPTSYSLLNYTSSISVDMLSGYGVFTGTLSAGLHHINYIVSNNIGDSIYCLTLSAL